MAKVKPIPKGYHAITPYLVVSGGEAAIAYYKKAFGAKLTVKMPMPGGKVGHAEMKIGDSMIMLADEFHEAGFKSPHSYGGAAVTIVLYVTKCDVVFKKAVKLGGMIFKPMQDQFYGDRSGTLVDPFGHVWTICTHVKNVSAKEMKKAMAAMSKS
jgi:PhnB protein